MKLDQKFFEKWKRLFPWDEKKIDKIAELSSDKQKPEAATFLTNKIKILKSMASTTKTRAAISALRTQKRAILAKENPWYGKIANQVQNFSRVLATGALADAVINITSEVIKSQTGFEVPEFVRKGAKFVMMTQLIKPSMVVVNWTKDTLVEAVDVVKERLEESKASGDGKVKTAWNIAKDLGSHVVWRAYDAAAKIGEKTKETAKNILDTGHKIGTWCREKWDVLLN